MAVPSRVFVGMTVFGLIATLLTVPYAILVLTGLRPGAPSPALSFDAAGPGYQLFAVAAAAMSVGITVFAWRSLLQGARTDARRRAVRAQVADEARRYHHQHRPPRGPT